MTQVDTPPQYIFISNHELFHYGTHTQATTLNTYGKFVTNLDLIKDDSSLVIYDMEFGDEECTTCDMDGQYEIPRCSIINIFDISSDDDYYSDSDDKDDPENVIEVYKVSSGADIITP